MRTTSPVCQSFSSPQTVYNSSRLTAVPKPVPNQRAAPNRKPPYGIAARGAAVDVIGRNAMLSSRLRMDSARTDLARRVLEALTHGHPVPTHDAIRLRNWAVRSEDIRSEERRVVQE